MAFQRKKQGGGNSKPALSVQLSVKQGQGYIKGPSFGFWPNEEGGPAYRGTLKGEYLAQVLEFLSNAYDADLPVGMAMFDNSDKKPSSGGFKKPGFGSPAKKPNPFKKQQEDEQGEPEF